MSDNKQQQPQLQPQPPPPQPQQQTAAVLDQNGQQVQVQVQMTQQQAHDGAGAAPQQQPAQPQAPPGATGPPQHAVQQQQQQQQQQQVAVHQQQPGTPSGVTVVSSGVGAQCVQVPTSSIQMQQQQQQAQQSVAATMQTQPVIAPAPMPSQSGTTTITTMSTLHQPLQHPMPPPTPQPLAQHPGVPHSAQMQQVSEWGHGRVQVIQQPLQNPTYLQQLYNTQGQLLMPSNLQLHATGMNPPSIHVITAGKPFQPNQLPPQMITTQKSVLQGQAASFPGYATIPTTTNQTLVISQLGVISNQPNILPAHSASTGAAKPTDMQKYTTCGGGRTVQQSSQPVQFSPWQFAGTSLPQGITWATAAPGGIQSPTALLTAPNPIFIRGQQDGTGMFIQSPPPQIQSHNPTLATPTAMPGVQQMTGKPRQTMEMPTNIQPKAAVPRALSSILPSMTGSPIRPASSVSTQTGGSTQMNATSTQVQTQKAQTKVRTKLAVNRTSPAPGAATQKADAANQTKPQAISPASQAQQMAGTKMILTSTGTAVSVGTTTTVAAGSPVSAEKSQQTVVPQNNKGIQQQQVALQQQPQQQIQQQQINIQQQIQQQPQLQHFQQQPQSQTQAQSQQQQQQASQQQLQQAQQQTPQKPVVGMTTVQAQTVHVPGPPVAQQQIAQQTATAAAAVAASVQQMGSTPPPERPVMPVVSLAPAPSPLPLQTTLPIPPNIQQCSPLASTVASQNMIVTSAVPQIQTVSPQQQPSQTQSQSQLQTQVQLTALSAPAAPVGSMGTQTVRDDAVSKAMEEQTTQGSAVTVSTPSQATPMETQEIADVDGSQVTGNGAIQIKEEKVVNGCVETSVTTNVMENGVVAEEVRTERERDKNPPKAMVKPQVLTHVIEGFVIQEASEPFAVNRSSLLNDLVQAAKPNNQQLSDKENQQIGGDDEPPKKKHSSDLLLVPLPPGPKGELEKCEFCGKVDLRSKFKKSKRFCSMSCAKSKRLGMFKPNSNQSAEGQTKKGTVSDMKEQWQKPVANKNQDWANGQPEGATGATDDNTDTNDSAASGPESSLSPSEAPDVPSVDMEDSSASESVTPATQPTQRVNPLKWTVSDVCEFIRTLPGCSDYVEDFAIQEIDGQALMLLKEDHLMTAMSMKLGPALKICAKIDTMRCDVKEK
ncbi:hypothetical protein B7P43_G02268 [Cryptotermes secundus]|uniref:SAM domain-containing protein n=2 Tax=Cryptotermes secundus TaxID=105785 RepID=A0A2J7QG84_9NEOP|nr:hypothetical protein B7P43_G02268 [Cryptotermes secundus]